MEFSEGEQKRLNLLIPEVAQKFVVLRDCCFARGVLIYLGSTLRTAAEQAQKQALGLSALKIGWHNLGRAFDAYPMLYSKELAKWQPDLGPKKPEQYRVMAEEGRKLGLHTLAFNDDWTPRYITVIKAGKKVKTRDFGHLECRGGYTTLADAIKAEGPNFGLGPVLVG